MFSTRHIQEERLARWRQALASEPASLQERTEPRTPSWSERHPKLMIVLSVSPMLCGAAVGFLAAAGILVSRLLQ
jgi:hypothetical protein